jgi:hypothetical protein
VKCVREDVLENSKTLCLKLNDRHLLTQAERNKKLSFCHHSSWGNSLLRPDIETEQGMKQTLLICYPSSCLLCIVAGVSTV